MKHPSKPAAKKATSTAKGAKLQKIKTPQTKTSKAEPPVPEASKDAAAAPSLALVRDRYVMPESDYALMAVLKKRAKAAGRSVKKSELLRAGLHALRDSGSVELLRILERLTPVASKKKVK